MFCIKYFKFRIVLILWIFYLPIKTLIVNTEKLFYYNLIVFCIVYCDVSCHKKRKKRKRKIYKLKTFSILYGIHHYVTWTQLLAFLGNNVKLFGNAFYPDKESLKNRLPAGLLREINEAIRSWRLLGCGRRTFLCWHC